MQVLGYWGAAVLKIQILNYLTYLNIIMIFDSEEPIFE